MIFFIKPLFGKRYQWGTKGNTDIYYYDLSDMARGWDYCWDDAQKKYSDGKRFF